MGRHFSGMGVQFCHSTSLNTKNSSEIYKNWYFIMLAKGLFIGVAETKVGMVFLCFMILACESSADTSIFLISIIFLQSLQYAVAVTGWDCNQCLNLILWGRRLGRDIFFWHVSYIYSISTTKWKFQLNHIRKEKSFFVCINHTSQTKQINFRQTKTNKSWPNKFRNYNSA